MTFAPHAHPAPPTRIPFACHASGIQSTLKRVWPRICVHPLCAHTHTQVWMQGASVAAATGSKLSSIRSPPLTPLLLARSSSRALSLRHTRTHTHKLCTRKHTHIHTHTHIYNISRSRAIVCVCARASLSRSLLLWLWLWLARSELTFCNRGARRGGEQVRRYDCPSAGIAYPRLMRPPPAVLAPSPWATRGHGHHPLAIVCLIPLALSHSLRCLSLSRTDALAYPLAHTPHIPSRTTLTPHIPRDT